VDERPPNAPKAPIWPEYLVRLLDDGLRVPGTNFGVGLDALLGFLLPGAGDVLTAAGSLGLFYAAYKQGVPAVVIARMALNVALDVVLGSLPVAGDVFDVVWKANRKNLVLIEEHRGKPQYKARVRDYLLVGGALLVMLAALLVPIVLMSLLIAYVASKLGH
jgi:hypothetical protein